MASVNFVTRSAIGPVAGGAGVPRPPRGAPPPGPPAAGAPPPGPRWPPGAGACAIATPTNTVEVMIIPRKNLFILLLLIARQNKASIFASFARAHASLTNRIVYDSIFSGNRFFTP